MHKRRSAFTLVEVLMATSLSVVALGLIYMAVDIYLRVLDAGRNSVEEAILTRAVFHRISDDIRAALPYDPLQSDQTMRLPSTIKADDVNKALASSKSAGLLDADVSQATPSQAAPVTGGMTSLLPGASGGSGASSGASSGSTTSTDDVGSADTLAANPIPGLFGESDWIQIDVSRLPRLDQMMMPDAAQSPDGLVMDRLSDLKTVKYYVASGDTAGATGGGLVRLEMDRAVTSYQAQNGGLDQASLNAQPIAPEVAAIQFQYFDGTEWQDYWDSQANGGLPWAVQITLSIVPPSARAGSAGQQGAGGVAADESNAVLIQRSLTVYLPAARSTLAQGSNTTSSDSSDSTGTTGGTTPQ